MDSTASSAQGELQHLQAAIQALEAQRSILGEALVHAAVKPLQERLTRLQGAQNAGQVRRQVSVLFLDVVGSTAMSQVLDPEDIHALVDGCLQRCTLVVQSHGGRVLQYAGDSLLAAFGTEPSQEDEAERAVHCGLRLLAEGRVLGEQALRDHGHRGCDVRVGIHTGPVLLGGGVDDDGSIRGLAVNIAARMEQTAPAGSLRISHDTWLLVRGAFEAQAQPPLQVKGSVEPLVTYLVQRARPVMEQVAARGIEGMRAPLVGRRDELSAVLGLTQAVDECGRLRAITLLGESGVGKSRLMQEFQASLDSHRERTWVLLARAHPPSRLQTYGLLRNLLAWQFLIPDSDTNEQARHRLVEGLWPWLQGTAAQIEGKAHWVGQLIGLDCSQHPAVRNLEPSAVRQYAFAALNEVLSNLGAAGRVPVVLVEDLQWADEGSLDFLHALMADPHSPPVALLATARLELLERRPDWGQGLEQHRSLLLKPLAPADAMAMAQALLAPLEDQGAALCERLVTLADGNPYFLEELVRMCLDHGVIVPETAERWRVVPERLGEARMPTTLVGVVQSRLDALSPSERTALQQAAVVGHVFWESALASMDARAPQCLPALQARALVLPRKASSFEGTAEKAFGHHLLQQVTYDTVLRPARQAGHAVTAAWLAERVGDRSSEFLSITAYHFEQAGQLTQASLFYERAAKEAADRFANAAVMEHVERALRCADPADLRRQFDLRTLRQTAADVSGRRAEQEVEVRARLALAAQIGDEALLASATFGDALLASRRSNHAEALRLAALAMEQADRSGATVPAALARAQLAWSHHARGDSATALPLAEQAVACARAALAQSDTLEHRTLLTRVMAIQSGVLNGAGQLQRSQVIRQEGLQRAQADGIRILQALFRDQMGTYYADTGQDLAALPHFEAGVALAHELGNSFSEAITRYNLACSLHSLRRFDESMAQVLAALKLVMDAEMTEVQGRCHLLIGRLHLDDGAEVRAQLAFQACIEAFAAAGLPHYESQGHAGLALLALGQGDLERARASAEAVDQRIQNNEALVGIDSPCLPLLACWKVWHRSGDARALPALRRVVGIVQNIAQLAGDDAALRRSVLENVPLHREVMQAWQAHGDGPPIQGGT